MKPLKQSFSAIKETSLSWLPLTHKRFFLRGKEEKSNPYDAGTLLKAHGFLPPCSGLSDAANKGEGTRGEEPVLPALGTRLGGEGGPERVRAV